MQLSGLLVNTVQEIKHFMEGDDKKKHGGVTF